MCLAMCLKKPRMVMVFINIVFIKKSVYWQTVVKSGFRIPEFNSHLRRPLQEHGAYNFHS